jgi:hypothetical protein
VCERKANGALRPESIRPTFEAKSVTTIAELLSPNLKMTIGVNVARGGRSRTYDASAVDVAARHRFRNAPQATALSAYRMVQ